MAAPMVEQYSIPVHVGPWTLDDWLALPPSTMRIELVDGMLVVSNMESIPNRRLMARILRQLDDAIPPTMEALPDINAILGDSRGLIPDFAVIDVPGVEGKALAARHFVMVGEIASPSTRRYDRTTKRALYAESGIRYLMLLDPGDPPLAELYELQAGEYVEIARSKRGVLEMSRPFPAVLDLSPPARPPGA